ncbi:MAG: hypothetical protein C4342_00125 [Armatimonadota bacterium]
MELESLDNLTPEELRRMVVELRQALAEREREVEDLKTHRMAARPVADAAVEAAPITELDTTLRRLVHRIAMILQADKVVMMFFERETGELMGIPPAYGVDEDMLSMFRLRATHGVSGKVFREGKPIIFSDPVRDEAAAEDPFSILHVTNGVTVPLVKRTV